MSSAFLQIQQAVVAALSSAPALAGGHVSEPKRRPVPPEWSSHIEVRLAGADGQYPFAGHGTPGVWESVIAVDCYVRADAGSTATATLDTLLGDVYARVSALSLSALGVTDVMPNAHIDWDWDDSATPQAIATLKFSIKHDTSAGIAV